MRQSFGKGLESLIPKKHEKGPAVSGTKQEPVFYIEIEKIKSNPYQPRKDFDAEALNALAESVKEFGILQPLLVSRVSKETGTEYQLIAGERRLLAAKIVGLNQVPVIVKDPTEKEKLEVSLIENVQRQDLNAIEKAEAYKKLQDDFGFKNKDIARLCGKSDSAVVNTLRLLSLPEEIKMAVRENKISEGHARPMVSIEDAQQQRVVFTKTVRDGLSVRDVESMAQRLRVWQPAKRIISAADQAAKDLEAKIKNILGIQALSLRITEGKPKVTIFFDSQKEAEDFFSKIKFS